MSTPYSRALDGNKNWRYRVFDLFVMVKGEKRHLHGLMDALDCVTKLFQVEFAPFNKPIHAPSLHYKPSKILKCRCITKPLSRDHPKPLLKSAAHLADITNKSFKNNTNAVSTNLQAPFVASAQCSVLKAPCTEKPPMQMIIDELFDPPTSTRSTQY